MRDLRALVAIAATYVVFLLFDQFAWLELLQRHFDAAGVERAMAAMGLAGLATSLATAAALGRFDGRRLLVGGLLGAGLCAFLAPWAVEAAGAWAANASLALSAAIGMATAVVTVSLAAELRGWMQSPQGRSSRFGWQVGLATGLAYAFCNLPMVFHAEPTVQSFIAGGVAWLAALAQWGQARGRASALETSPAAKDAAGIALAPRDAQVWPLVGWVLAFLGLIWLDSAAFAVIQQTVGLKAQTWGQGTATLYLGALHLLAALAAGWAIDRGFFRGLLLVAWLFFAGALSLLQGHQGGGAGALAGPLYALAVSLYSVALVAYPSYLPEATGLVARRWRAGWVYGVAGWLGSALGVGMAQNLHRVPPIFLGVVLVALSTFVWLTQKPRRAGAAPLWREQIAIVVGLGVGLLFFGWQEIQGARTAPPEEALPEMASPETVSPAAARGRQVYIAEGCINCHSQYIRPGTRDEALWGQHRDLDREHERPPLIGLRRQGPDLSNIGARLDREQLRRQLIDPRSVVPASTMPSYAHLFPDPSASAAGAAADPSSRGEELLDYLLTLHPPPAPQELP